MRVILNRLSALARRTGVGHYTNQLLRALRQRTNADRIDIQSFPGPGIAALASIWGRVRDLIETRSFEESTEGTSWMSGFQRQAKQLLLRRARTEIARTEPDIYHEPNYIPIPSEIPTVITFHDLSVIRHPEWHPRERVRDFEKHLPRILSQGSHFLTPTEFIRQELIDLLGISPQRVTKVHCGVRPNFRPLPPAIVAAVLRKLNLPFRYLLCVGTVEPRKNLLPLLREYCALPATLRERWPLLVVGPWGWHAGPVATFIAARGRDCNVRHIGYVSENYLPAIFNGARALLFPSLYEGFGLPPVEMLACRGAVIASTAESLVEILGRRVCLVDPEDHEGWRDAIRRVMTDDEWWRSLRPEPRKSASLYTWGRCADETLEVYRAVAGGTSPRASRLISVAA